MLSPLSRFLTRVMAFAYAILGIILFLAPAWSSANFPWSVSPFVAMTMGGWCLGNAYAAWESARIWRWSIVYPLMIYLWVFGLLEAAVLAAFRDRVVLDGFLSVPYISALAITLLSGITGLLDLARLRPAITPEGAPVTRWVRVTGILFVIFVGLIALVALVGRQGGLGTEGQIFPEKMTLFTLRAFGVFYLALAIEVASVLGTRGMEPVLLMERAGLALIIPITAAALINIGLFDFTGRPGGLIYLAAYIITFIIILVTFRTQRSNSMVRRETA